MTTIAWRFPFMASDGRCTDGSQIVTDKMDKIVRLSCGGLLGLAGDADQRSVVELFDRIKNGKTLPDAKAILELNTDFAGILALPDGTIWSVESEQPEDTDKRQSACVLELHDHFAVGSGGKFAKAAMDMGATAERAVRLAMKNDSASGGRVHVHELKLRRARRQPA